MATLVGRHLHPFMDLRRPGQTTGHCAGVSGLNGHKVDRRVLPSSVDFEVEFEPVAFVDPGKARTFDRADMHESVFLAVIAGDESKALHRIEELDRAGGLFAGKLALRRARRHGNNVADNLQVGSGNFPASIDQVELQFLPFGEPFEAGAFDLADVDEHVFTAFVALDEAKALLDVEEFYLALAGADNLRGHSATTTAAAIARRAATTAATETATATAEAAAAATASVVATESVTAAELRRSVITEGIKRFFAEPIPLVAPPAATASIVTHLTNAPSFRPRLTPGDMDEFAPDGSRRRSPRIIAPIL
jgi:hypothetical protein